MAIGYERRPGNPALDRAARLTRVDEDLGDASAWDRDRAMSQRRDRDEIQERDERGRRQNGPAAAVDVKTTARSR